MADITLPVKTASSAGDTPIRSVITATDTYFVRNNGRIVMLFEKTGAGDANVTISTPATVGGLAIEDRIITIPGDTGDVVVAGLPASVFNDSNGDLTFTSDEGTALTCAVMSL